MAAGAEERHGPAVLEVKLWAIQRSQWPGLPVGSAEQRGGGRWHEAQGQQVGYPENDWGRCLVPRAIAVS
jgi:hypothetical protein